VSSDLHHRSKGCLSETRGRKRGFQRWRPVQLSSLDQPSSTEPTSTQNISSSGARVMTQRIWAPGSRLFISLSETASGLGRMWLLEVFLSSRFAIGLEFFSQAGNWPKQISLRRIFLHFNSWVCARRWAMKTRASIRLRK